MQDYNVGAHSTSDVNVILIQVFLAELDRTKGGIPLTLLALTHLSVDILNNGPCLSSIRDNSRTCVLFAIIEQAREQLFDGLPLVDRNSPRHHYTPMIVEEIVILPLPTRVAEIRYAAARYEQQHQVRVLLQVQGHVTREHGGPYAIRHWQTVGDMDLDLDLIGLGVVGADWEQLAWVIPSGPGKLRLSPLSDEEIEC
jgi:hypothetical protein